MQIKFLPEQNFELLSEISIRKNFSSISFFSKVQRVRIRRRNTTLDASFISKLKNIFEELSFDFPFLQFAIHPPRRSKEQRGNKNWKILGAHRQSFDRGPLLPTFSPAAAPIASSLEPGKFSFPANHRKIPFQDLVSLRSSA